MEIMLFSPGFSRVQPQALLSRIRNERCKGRLLNVHIPVSLIEDVLWDLPLLAVAGASPSHRLYAGYNEVAE